MDLAFGQQFNKQTTQETGEFTVDGKLLSWKFKFFKNYLSSSNPINLNQ